ncbi:DUF5085 family protein [Enterococcus faecalis]|uniref:DUF5085 family protein n=1 Tax=Enterococcus faecalis TaxID=1351 RepID=UPI00136DCD45|nr:DUF5085 family protein [Enterococcus faecalis]NAA54082.1 DUF5085 family protein [Enterococcus faecalis]
MFNLTKKKKQGRSLGYNQSIHVTNVVSRYYEVDLKNFAKVFEEFVVTVVQSGYTPKSNFFYSINSDIRETTDMILQVFISVEEDKVYELPEEYRYQSYYEVKNMLGVRVAGENELDFAEGIGALIEEIVAIDAELSSPPFYFVTQIGDKTYTDILIGIKEKE